VSIQCPEKTINCILNLNPRQLIFQMKKIITNLLAVLVVFFLVGLILTLLIDSDEVGTDDDSSEVSIEQEIASDQQPKPNQSPPDAAELESRQVLFRQIQTTMGIAGQTAQMLYQSAAQVAQQTEQIIQTNQSMGIPLDQATAAVRQQNGVRLQALTYMMGEIAAFNELASWIGQNPNRLAEEGIWATALGLYATVSYRQFGADNHFANLNRPATYRELAPHALQWLPARGFSDMQQTVDYLKGVNQINQQAMVGSLSGVASQLQQSETHQQRFSDIILGQSRWRDPQNGDTYVLPITTEGAILYDLAGGYRELER
jgi:ABC-type cobalt transport system substrate-binding protein